MWVGLSSSLGSWVTLPSSCRILFISLRPRAHNRNVNGSPSAWSCSCSCCCSWCWLHGSGRQLHSFRLPWGVAKLTNMPGLTPGLAPPGHQSQKNRPSFSGHMWASVSECCAGKVVVSPSPLSPWLPECHVNVNASALCTFAVPQRACHALPHATSFSHTSCPSATAAAAGCGIVGSVLSRVSNSIELWVLCDTPTPAASALGMSACADTLHFKLCCFFS